MKVAEAEERDAAAIRALVIAARADGDAAIELVASEDRELAGHILFSPMKAPFRALALAPIAVLPARQRSGIGGALIRAGLDRAKGEGWEGVFVLGEPDYYRRFGFDPALGASFESAYSGPYLMALALGDGLPAEHGPIRHAAAFAALG